MGLTVTARPQSEHTRSPSHIASGGTSCSSRTPREKLPRHDPSGSRSGRFGGWNLWCWSSTIAPCAIRCFPSSMTPARAADRSGSCRSPVPQRHAAQADRLKLGAVPELDGELELSARLDPDAVPAVVLLDGGDERGRVEGLDRALLAQLAGQAGVTLELDGLPERRPGLRQRHARPGRRSGSCGARRAALAAGCARGSCRSASSRIRSRRCSTAATPMACR